MRIGAVGKLGMAALFGATLAVAGPRPAWAEGAIAFGTTGKVERDGIAFGLVVDEPPGKAAELAVKRCRTFEAKAAAARCELVATFSGQCFAIAYDPTPGTPGAGWGVGDDQLAANQKAVAMCEQSAGPARKGYCQVNAYGCDTGPKLPPKFGTESKPDSAPKAPETRSEAKPEGAPAPDIDTKAAPEAKKAEAPKAGTEAKQPNAAQDVRPTSKPPPTPVRAEPKAQSPASPLLPVLAMAGVGLAYFAGQHVRGRAKGGLEERQIITGGALAVMAAIAVKLLELLGVGTMTAAAVAVLFALGAALVA